MKDNPLWSWALQRLKSEPRGWAALMMFLLMFYGMTGMTLVAWSGTFPRKMEEFCTTLHYEAWAMNALVLLLYAPARMASALARERERGTLDMMRLTGLSGRQVALGQAGTALILPLVMVASTLPIVLLGLVGQGGFEAVLRGYVGLLVCAPVYLLAAGIAGLSVKKAQSAGGTAIFMVMITLASGLFLGPWHELKPLSLLGPWGPGLATVNRNLNLLMVAGEPVPGELLQVPLMFALAKALLDGLARRIDGDPAVVLGRRGAIVLSCGVAVVAFLTFSPNALLDDFWFLRGGPPPATNQLFARYLILWGALLLLALEIPVGWRDLVRGLCRRDPDDAPFPHERLTVRRFAWGPGLVLGFTAAASWSVWVTDDIDAGTLLGCAGVVALSWTLAALTFQASLLLTKGQGMPRLFAVLALLLFWCGPFAASLVLSELQVPGVFLTVTRLPNPIYAFYLAAHHVEISANVGAFDPLSLAMGTVVVQGLACWGVWKLVQAGMQRAQERAAGLVALPADAYAAPGSLTQRCPQGHLFTAAWKSCPHCEESAEAAPATRPPASP